MKVKEFKKVKDFMQKANLFKGRQGQAGFTLLELLVVVAILAAIAGTTTIALQDTDARAAAAAHVAMMDELDKAIRTFDVLPNDRVYPNNFDSLLQDTGGTIAALGTLAVEGTDLGIYTIPTGGEIDDRLHDVNITNLRMVHVDAAYDPDGDGDCSDIEALIRDRNNAVVAGNIYLSVDANGCGDDYPVAEGNSIMVWTGGTERITGRQLDAATTDHSATGYALTLGTPGGADTELPVFMAVGVGPACELFDKRVLGSLSTVPAYRHVASHEYNRFIALFHIANVDTTGTVNPVDMVNLAAIIDGAGDTKDEELGEWDGTRSTI